MVAQTKTLNLLFLQRFSWLSTAGDKVVDNMTQPSVSPICSPQMHNQSGSIGIIPWINCVHACA